MSTASVVEFTGNKIQLYVHHDGYPEHMIPLLRAFLKWNHARLDDAGYTAANFIYWYKKRCLKKARAMSREYDDLKPVDKGFLLQVEQTGVGLFQYSTRREMHDNCISYYYKVHLVSPTHKNDTIVDKFTNLGTDYIAIDVYTVGSTTRDDRVEVTI